MRSRLWSWVIASLALVATAATVAPVTARSPDTVTPPGPLGAGGSARRRGHAVRATRRALAGGPGAHVFPRRSRSLGLPWRGRLRRSVPLVPNRFVRHVGEYASTGNFWGTWELVQLLERTARRVWQRAPGARLSVGELSSRLGGNIPGHHSHENGRDVDIAFYMLDAQGRPFEPYAFAEFDARGRGIAPNDGLTFDDRRNWELVARLVTDGDARVQFAFVSAPIERRLLAMGRRLRARSVVLGRVARALVQPTSGHPHRNHFHVRIYCSPANRPACEDRAPFHPWYPGRPPR